LKKGLREPVFFNEAVKNRGHPNRGRPLDCLLRWLAAPITGPLSRF
jgi:hypothetical protein